MDTVISITTTPPRLPYIDPVIASLKKQDLPVQLWIPQFYKRGNQSFNGKIPDFCHGINVEIVEDEGPITKLLPAIRAGFKRIITADDDRIVPEGWAAGLMSYSDARPNAAYGYCGRILQKHHRDFRRGTFVYSPHFPTPVTIIEGAMGALYLNSFFTDSIYNESQKYYTQDDIAISLHLKEHGVPMMVVPGPPLKDCSVSSIQPLGQKNMNGGNKAYLAKYNTRFRLLGIDPIVEHRRHPSRAIRPSPHSPS
jgi:hypothetical protein